MYVHFVWGYFDKCGGDIDGGDFAVGRFDLHSLQSQEILKRPVFVLEILNITENSEQSLNITNNSEKSLNRV
jgi:hypothetical protein